MGSLAEKLGQKASEKITQLYNAGVRKRNEIASNIKEKRRKEEALRQDLKHEENLAYEREMRKQARQKGKRRAKGGSGVKRVLTGLSNTAELMFPEFTGKRQPARQQPHKKKSKPKPKRKKETRQRDILDEVLGL